MYLVAILHAAATEISAAQQHRQLPGIHSRSRRRRRRYHC